MKLIDRYLIREMVVPFLAGMLIVLVLWIGNIVFYQVSILRGRTELFPVFIQYVLLKSTYYVTLSLAAGSLFGAALAVSRLTRDSEITVMRVAGASVRRIFLPLLVVGVVVSSLAFLVQEKLVPSAERRSSKLLYRLYYIQGPPPMAADVFFNWQNYYFYVRNVQRVGRSAELAGVTVWELPAGRGYPMIITAERATWVREIIEMRDGVVHKLGADGFTEQEAKFKRLRLNLRQVFSQVFQTQKTPEQMTTSELVRKIRAYSSTGFSSSGLPSGYLSNLRLEYHFKLSVPLSSIILIMCAAPLGLRFGRHSSFAGALMGIVIVFLYWNVLLFSKLFSQSGWLPPALAGWSQVIIFALLGAVLIWKAE